MPAAAPQSLPKISCLMVSRGRLFPARFAVECYQRQTYPNRELVVLCDEPESELETWLGELADPTIRFLRSEKKILGALRNDAIAAARGELLCQWDDDDLYHPQRLKIQYGLMRKSAVDAIFLSHLVLWWPERRAFAISARRVWEGSILARREVVLPYPELARREDTIMVDALRERTRIVAWQRPALYVYAVHGRNTWDQEHFEKIFRRATVRVKSENYDKQLANIARVMPIDRYAACLAEASASP